jgi:hypothetical protein
LEERDLQKISYIFKNNAIKNKRISYGYDIYDRNMRGTANLFRILTGVKNKPARKERGDGNSLTCLVYRYSPPQ